MARSDRFIAQHRDLQELVRTLSALLDVATLSKSSVEARKVLSTLGGKIGMHLAVEDNTLYPDLIASTDPAVRKTAERFKAEMGGLSGAFTSYSTRWNEMTIQAQPADFIKETKAIAEALGQRIQREEAELYPMLDATRRAS